MIYDAEFREIKDRDDAQHKPDDEVAAQEENKDNDGYRDRSREISDFEEYKKEHDVKKKERSRKSRRSPG